MFCVSTCASCHSKWVADPPVDISDYYPDNYYSYSTAARAESRLVSLLRKLTKTYLARISVSRSSARMNKLLPALFNVDAYLAANGSRLGASVLDVGCGAGQALDIYQSAGWETHGIEIDADAAARARSRGHKVAVGEVAGTSLPQGRYDVVRATHVVEHTAEPLRTVRQLVSSVAPGGTLFIEIPNLRSVMGWAAGDYFWHLDPPRHLAIPSRSALLGELESSAIASLQVSTRTFGTGLARSVWLWWTWREGKSGWYTSDRAPWPMRAIAFALSPVALIADLFRVGDTLRVLVVMDPAAMSPAEILTVA